MGSQILRPTGPGKKKQEQPWLVRGSWGQRNYPRGTRTELYELLYDELVNAGLLDKCALRPTRRYHAEVVDLIMHSHWSDGRWVLDEAVRPNR